MSILPFTDSNYPFVISKLFFNRFGHQFHQLLQNQQLPSHFKLLNRKKTTIYTDEDLSPGFGQAQ